MEIKKIEKNILKFWEENKIFEKSVENRKKAKDFVFYEGPPTANGRPGIHHVLSRAFKDIICRYKTMRGFRVLRKAGWDTHGLPVEIEVERQLGLKNKKDIEKYGIAKFNKKCRESVWKYKSDWEDLTRKIGFWLDMDDPYITYERDYMETLWRIIKQVWKKKLLYQDFKVVPYCARCGTGLSSHEVALGYKKITEPSIYFKLKIKNPKFKNTSLLVWTTTPWTLPGNVAVAVHPDIDYVKVTSNKEDLILAKARLGVLEGEYWVTKELKGKDLLDLEYEPLFSFLKPDKKAHYVIRGDFVSVEEGTGMVHIAPAFGEEDLEVGKENDLPVLMTMNKDGRFIKEVEPWAGERVKDADPKIIDSLAATHELYKIESYEHDYPFCWRCDSPLLYLAKKSWFIKMTQVKKELIRNNKTINWVPDYLKEGRFGEWLRELKDWAFSRERYWGTPLPLWRCEGCKKEDVIGSSEELLTKTFTTNTYFLLRHGEAESNVKQFVSSFPEPNPNHLTRKGKKAIEGLIPKLKKQHIDFIISSPLMRTKETAEIIGKGLGVKVKTEAGLREIDSGILNGETVEDYHKFYDYDREREFTKKATDAENLIDVKNRMLKAIRAIDKRHQGKNILLVSHEYPLWMLEGSMVGLNQKELLDFRKRFKIDPGELRKLSYTAMPYNDKGEVDLHRPYIDEVQFLCEKCGAKMQRVEDLIDVWFDSGAMPYAQNPSGFWAKGPERSGGTKSETTKKNFLFPADFICEGIDQTRGWFYTLLAISTLLELGPSYKNVISHGLVLDKKGEKMSKSRGNVVDPWEIIEKYGADAVRWYFFTVNQPGEVKKFDEAEVGERMRRFVGTLYNIHLFFETYVSKNRQQTTDNRQQKSKNILDKWVLSRLNELIDIVTKSLDEYNVISAARGIESFVDDLSNWYVRRSRRRFQRPENKKEKQEAQATLGFVLRELSKLTSPFAPFISEEIYRTLKNRKGKESVHLEDWPKLNKPLIDKKLNDQMNMVRRIVALGLKVRARSGTRVRQPLAKLEFLRQGSGQAGIRNKVSEDLAELIKEELNVKEVEFVKTLNKNFAKEKEREIEVAFDTEITSQLKEEGMIRDITRTIQDMRKEAGYQPSWPAELLLAARDSLSETLKRWENFIKKETNTKHIVFESKAKTFDIEKEISMDGATLRVGIRRI